MKTFVSNSLLLSAFLLNAPMAHAQISFASIEEMIKDADVIAVVEVLEARPARITEANLRHKDMVANMRIETVIKGEMPTGVTASMFLMDGFPYVTVDVRPGTYLVFLRLHEDVLLNSNWHVSLRPIREGSVEWFSERTKNVVYLSLDDVTAEIRATLSSGL